MEEDHPKEILIIKTGYNEILDRQNNSTKPSFGDVFRTTVLLPLYKNDNVTWVSAIEAFPLLEGNPYIQRFLPWGLETSLHLPLERFDTLINLEKTPGICVWAERIFAVNRHGFVFDPTTRKAKMHGKVLDVLAVSSDIELKRANQKKFQDLLYEMVDSKWSGEGYILGYKPVSEEKFDVGLNTFVGPKWPTKSWSDKNWGELEARLRADGLNVTRQSNKDSDNLYGYMGWINSSRLIVTSDSLGMHLGLALNKKVLALFGPTPHKEVHFYGRGNALLPDPVPDCMPCFREDCIREEKCTEDIPVQRVYEETKKLLAS